MDADAQLDRIIRAARQADRPAPRDLGFETRLLAGLRAERGGTFGAMAWRLVPFCAAVTVAAGIWFWTAPAQNFLFAMASPQPDQRALVDFFKRG